MPRFKNLVVILTLLAFLIIGLVSFGRGEGFFGWIDFLVNKDTQPALFIFLMAIMPIVGFPLSIFLILAGVKFGLIWGFFLTAFTMAIHLTVSYLLANSVFKPYLDGILGRHWKQLRAVWERASLSNLFFLTVIPGLPYAVKNYALSLSGISFPIYFAIGWTTQFVMGLPFVALGRHAARMNLQFVIWLLVLVALLYLVINKFYRKKSSPLGFSRKDKKENNNS